MKLYVMRKNNYIEPIILYDRKKISGYIRFCARVDFGNWSRDSLQNYTLFTQ